MVLVWNCLYCGKELLKEDDFTIEGDALEVAKKIQDRLDYLSSECECENKDRKLYTNWFKDGKALSRRDYYKYAKMADGERKRIPDYLIELGFKHGKITNDKLAVNERQRGMANRNPDRKVKFTYWQKDGYYLDIREYERFAKNAQKQGISNAEYLEDLGYTRGGYKNPKLTLKELRNFIDKKIDIDCRNTDCSKCCLKIEFCKKKKTCG